MFPYKKYLIKSSDQFDPVYYSFVDIDMETMIDETKDSAADFKQEIILYFLQDHSFQNEWVIANPALVQLVQSKPLPSGNIKSLFESCHNNPVFKQQLETYIKGKIAETYS